MVHVMPINSNTLALVITNTVNNPVTGKTDITFNTVDNNTIGLMIPLNFYSLKRNQKKMNIINKPNWKKMHVFFQFPTKGMDEDALFNLTYDTIIKEFNPDINVIICHALSKYNNGFKRIIFKQSKGKYVAFDLDNESGVNCFIPL